MNKAFKQKNKDSRILIQAGKLAEGVAIYYIDTVHTNR